MKYGNCVLINSWFDWIINRVVLPIAVGLLCSQIVGLWVLHFFTPQIELTFIGAVTLTLLTGVCVRNMLLRKNSKGYLSVTVGASLFLFFLFEWVPREPTIAFAEMLFAFLLLTHFGARLSTEEN
ncbi:MAG: hypothetical protein NUV54_01755 [Candidatus Taylorbacteria bacterium]|nr:hypothetical protein [Candidatus Taylorbacteria bacterium]